MTISRLAGRRVMVVEDELLVSMLIEDTLAAEDCVLIGPFTTLAAATVAAKENDIDAALLDVNLRGDKVYPVAEILMERAIPFLLLSGYGRDAIPANRPGWRACNKPFSPVQLAHMLADQIDSCSVQNAEI